MIAMALFQEPAELPDDFAGVARVFPLPNLVLFPHVVQALHVFEPRYREMVEDALATDQLISIALLKPGWEADYEGRPEIHPIICIGRVVAHARLEDGRYNILLHGLRRAAVIHELPAEFSFRRAEVAIMDDVYQAGGAVRRSQIQRDLLRIFQRLVPDSPVVQEQFEQLLSQQLPLGVIADVIASSLPLDLEVKRQLLAEWNVDVRAEQLLARLETLSEQSAADGDAAPFPPGFSEN